MPSFVRFFACLTLSFFVACGGGSEGEEGLDGQGPGGQGPSGDNPFEGATWKDGLETGMAFLRAGILSYGSNEGFDASVQIKDKRVTAICPGVHGTCPDGDVFQFEWADGDNRAKEEAQRDVKGEILNAGANAHLLWGSWTRSLGHFDVDVQQYNGSSGDERFPLHVVAGTPSRTALPSSLERYSFVRAIGSTPTKQTQDATLSTLVQPEKITLEVEPSVASGPGGINHNSAVRLSGLSFKTGEYTGSDASYANLLLTLEIEEGSALGYDKEGSPAQGHRAHLYPDDLGGLAFSLPPFLTAEGSDLCAKSYMNCKVELRGVFFGPEREYVALSYEYEFYRSQGFVPNTTLAGLILLRKE